MNYYLSGYESVYFIHGYLKKQFGVYNVSFLLFSLIIKVAKFCRFSGLSVLKTFLNKSSGIIYIMGSNVSLALAYRGHSAMKWISFSTLSLQNLQKRSSAGIGVGLARLPLPISRSCVPIRILAIALIDWLLRLQLISVKLPIKCQGIRNTYSKWWHIFRAHFTDHHVHMFSVCKQVNTNNSSLITFFPGFWTSSWLVWMFLPNLMSLIMTCDGNSRW